MPNFDPYLQWLGIRSPERPPNHYRLLGVEPFESDADVIETAADRQMAHVRTFQNGKDADTSQQILNELAAAKLCLLNPAEKAAYDAELKRQYFNDPPPVDPATINVTATSSRTSDGSVEIDIDAEDSFHLARPKRNAGTFLSHRLGLLTLIVGLGCTAAAIYYFLPWFRTTVATDPATVRQEELTDNPDEVSESNDPAGNATVNPDEAGDTDQNSNPSPFDQEAGTTVDPSESTETNGSATNEPPPLQPNSIIDEPSVEDQDVETTSETTSESAPWTHDVRPQPFSIVSNSPLGAFAVALADRDVETARIVYESNLHSRGVSLSFATRLESLIVSQEQFWRAVGEAISELANAVKIEYRGKPVQVIGRRGDQIQMQAANGQRKMFSLASSEIDPDIAIGLALHRYQDSPAVAWRLIGAFLIIDKQGNVEMGRHYLQMAQQNGIAATGDLRAFEFLSQAAGTGDHLHAESGDAEDGDGDGDAESITATLPVAAPRHRIPGKNAARAAHKIIREDLATYFSNRTEQGQIALANHLIERSEVELNRPVYAYALLDSALKIGMQLGKADIVLRTLVSIAKSYDFDLLAEFEPTLKQIAPSRERDSAVIRTALELGNELLTQNALSLADDLHTIAESRLRSAPELTLQVQEFHSRLHQVVEINQFVDSAKLALETDSKNPEANQTMGIYYLVQRDFQLGLPHLVRGNDEDLQTVAMADLTAAPNARPNPQLARSWEDVADNYEGIVKSSMLARAKFWIDSN